MWSAVWGAVWCAAVLLGACAEGAFERAESEPVGDVAPPPTEQETLVAAAESLDAEATEQYLRKLAPIMLGRVLSSEERALVAAQGGAAIRPVLEGWGSDPGLRSSMRVLWDMKLSVGGSHGEFSHALPGNLVTHVVRDQLPWSTILTADKCFRADGSDYPCDSGAPYSAGILTTRAFLESRSGRYNLTRARAIVSGLLCDAYPLADDVEPRIERSRLIPMFQEDIGDAKEDKETEDGFGNGLACYTCHGQFALHAQLFVKFDRDGLWRGNATGRQRDIAMGAQLGESEAGLFASHLESPEESASERSQILGVPVENLGEAGRVIAQSDKFLACSSRSLVEYAFALDLSHSVSTATFARIAEQLRAEGVDPSLQDILVATFSEPAVVLSAVAGLGGKRFGEVLP